MHIDLFCLLPGQRQANAADSLLYRHCPPLELQAEQSPTAVPDHSIRKPAFSMAVVRHCRIRRLRPEHWQVCICSAPYRDHRWRVPVVAPTKICRYGPAASRGGIHELGPAWFGPVAVVEEAQGAVGAADTERVESLAGGHVEVGATYAVFAGCDPGVGGHEGAGGVVDVEDVDGKASYGGRRGVGAVAGAPELVRQMATGRLRRVLARRAEPEWVIHSEVPACCWLTIGVCCWVMEEERQDE